MSTATATVELSDEQIQSLQATYAALTPSDVERLIRETRKRQDSQGLSDEQLRLGVELRALVAKNASDGEWLDYIRHGALPEVVPLTPAQTEMARGGFLLAALVVIDVALIAYDAYLVSEL